MAALPEMIYYILATPEVPDETNVEHIFGYYRTITTARTRCFALIRDPDNTIWLYAIRPIRSDTLTQEQIDSVDTV